jgi:amphi-Trp domain-containing protein
MPAMKFEQKQTLSRAEAAARLSAIADALGADEKFQLERGGEKLELDVPDQVRFELEIEIKGDETELEVEIKWSTATEPAKAQKPKRAAAKGPAAKRATTKRQTAKRPAAKRAPAKRQTTKRPAAKRLR